MAVNFQGVKSILDFYYQKKVYILVDRTNGATLVSYNGTVGALSKTHQFHIHFRFRKHCSWTLNYISIKYFLNTREHFSIKLIFLFQINMIGFICLQKQNSRWINIKWHANQTSYHKYIIYTSKTIGTLLKTIKVR